MPKGFNALNPKTGNNVSRIDELVEVFKFPKNKWVTLRFLDTDILPCKQHWINIMTKEKKEVSIPRWCVAFDPETESNKEGVKCPYCELEDKRDSVYYYANAIIREDQEDEPRKKYPYDKEEKRTGFKNIQSKSWTPVKVVRLPPSLAQKIQELSELNKIKSKKTGKVVCYDVSNSRYGIDIQIKYKPDNAGSDKYAINKGDRTPLTEEEQQYLVWDIGPDILLDAGLQSEHEARKDVTKLNLTNGEEISQKPRKPDLNLDEDEEELEDEEIPKRKSREGIEAKNKKKYEEEEDYLDDDEDEEEIIPKSKKRRKPKDEDYLDDEDEEEEIISKKRRKPKDEDYLDDDDEDEDYEEIKSAKKRKKINDEDEEDEIKPKKRRKVVLDDDDEDEIPF